MVVVGLPFRRWPAATRNCRVSKGQDQCSLQMRHDVAVIVTGVDIPPEIPVSDL
jgi:hypothetical protein